MAYVNSASPIRKLSLLLPQIDRSLYTMLVTNTVLTFISVFISVKIKLIFSFKRERERGGERIIVLLDLSGPERDLLKEEDNTQKNVKKKNNNLCPNK